MKQGEKIVLPISADAREAKKVVVQEFTGAISQIERSANQTISRLEKSIKGIGGAFSGKKILGWDASTLQQVQKVVDQLKRINTIKPQIKVDDELAKARADIKRIQAERVSLAKSSNNAIRASNKALYDIQKSEIKSVENAFKSQVNSILAGIKQIKSASSGSFGSSPLGTSFLGSFGGNLAADAVSLLTSKIKEGAVSLFTYKSNIDSAKLSFENFLGSAEKAGNFVERLQKFSLSTPFQSEGFLDLSRRLLGAKVQVEEIIPLLKDLGNVVAGTGQATQERFEGVATAITQIISKQRVSAEEMEQLAERNIPAWTILSEAIGKTQAETRKLAEQGKISSDIMVLALQKFSREKFGDEMAKQAKIGTTALAKIADVVLQTASISFEPILNEVSKFASDTLEEVKKAKDFDEVGEIIARKIGEGFGRVSRNLAKQIGSELGKELGNFFGGKEESFLAQIFGNLEQGFDEGFWKPILGDDWFQKEWGDKIRKPIQSTETDLIKTNEAIKDVNDTVKTTQSIAKQLEADRAKAEAQKLIEVIKDLSLEIQFFGDKSQVASTKQKLLSQGITDFSTAQAQMALGLAETIDRLKQSEEAAEKYKKEIEDNQQKVNDFRAELLKMRQDADFEITFAKPTKLDELKRKVNENSFAFKGLAGEIELTERALQRLQNTQNARKSLDNYGQLIKGISEAAKEKGLSGINLNPLQEALLNVARNANLAKTEISQIGAAGGIDVTDLTFVNKLEGYLNTVKELQSAGIALYQKLPGGEVLATEPLVKLNAEMTKFLDSLKILGDDNKTLIPLFRDAGLIPPFLDNLIQLSNTIKNVDESAKKAEGLETYKKTVEELNSKLFESSEITEVQRTQNLLLTDSYQGLTVAQKDHLLSKAQEVDAYRETQKAMEEYRRQAEETQQAVKGFFSDSLTSLIEDGWSGLFKSLKDKFKRFLIEAAADFLTSKFLQIFKGGFLGGGQSSGGGGSGFSLGNIFGGGGIGGTPPFAGNNFAFAGGGGGAGGFGGISNLFSQTASGPLSTSGNLSTSLGLRDGSNFSLGNVGPGATSNLSGYSQIKQLFSAKGLGSLAPLLGLGLGGALGGNSIGGQILGSAGGLAAGLGVGVLTGAINPGTLGLGGIASSYGLLAATGVLAGIAAPLLIGAYLLKRNKLRRQEETQRDQFMTEALTQLKSIKSEMEAARPGINVQGLLENAKEISANYFVQANALKDKKTRGIAIKDGRERVGMYPLEPQYPAALLNQIFALGDTANLKEEIRAAAYERDRRIIPEFAAGAFVKAKNGGHLAIVGEGGYDEFILSTDPKHANRTANLMGQFIERMNFQVPKYEAGANSSGAFPTGFSLGNITNNIEILLEQDDEGRWHAIAKSSAGTETIVTVTEKAYNGRKLKLGRK